MRRSRVTITIRQDLLPQIDNIIDKEKIRNRSHAIEHLIMKGLRSGIKKAYILAATRGEKLESLTSSLPQAMLKIKGKPVLQYIIEQLKESIVVNEKLLEKIWVVSEKTKNLLNSLLRYGFGKVTGAGGRETNSGYILFFAEDENELKKFLKNNKVNYYQFIPDYQGLIRI